jgi:uncharacterized protein (TIGR02611 family)
MHDGMPTEQPDDESNRDSPSELDTRRIKPEERARSALHMDRRRHPLRRLRARARLLRIRLGATPGGRTAFKLAVAASGGVFVIIGLVLVPLPGPGWAIVFGGLAIWAIEFVWARRLLDWVRRKVRAWTAWVKLLPWVVRASLAISVAVGLVSISWLWVKHRYGFATAGQLWEYLTTH